MRSLFCDVRYVRSGSGMVSWVRICLRRRRMEVRARFRCCEVLSLRERVIRSEVVRMVGLADPGVWHTHAPRIDYCPCPVSVCPIRLCERKQCDATSAARTARHCTLPFRRPPSKRAYPTFSRTASPASTSSRVFLLSFRPPTGTFLSQSAGNHTIDIDYFVESLYSLCA